MCKLCRDRDKVIESASNFDSVDLAESGNSRIALISESGLYRVLAKSNLPKCEPFEAYVFDEALPAIRKTGNLRVYKEGMPKLSAACGRKQTIPHYLHKCFHHRALFHGALFV